MPTIPLIGRLYFREYVAVILGCFFIAFEIILRLIVLVLPSPVITWFHDHSRNIFHKFFGKPKNKTAEQKRADCIRLAIDFGELCEVFGYSYEEHVVQTKDGYLLGLHRLPSKKGFKKSRPGTSTGKPVVYLHHGLLMNSDIWLCSTTEERCLPLVLVEAGFDVWLGNNRGNKYSKKHISLSPNSRRFWNFSIDDFAWRDIPDSIEYILGVTKVPSLSYVGFSQGTAQAFAALSIQPQLNERVDLFVALAPAMSPPGLSQPIVDALMKSSPSLMFLFFGRRSILSSTVMWQSILYPPIFAKVIDFFLGLLFSWHGNNIDPYQKVAAYAHLYSYASTKSVVHWFQIMRNAAFQMYDDDVQTTVPLPLTGTFRSFYRPARFPTRNIATPIVLLYGTKDSLVDIDVMMNALPEHTVARPLRGYEHVDVLWGRNVHKDVIPEVVKALKAYSPGSVNFLEKYGEGLGIAEARGREHDKESNVTIVNTNGNGGLLVQSPEKEKDRDGLVLEKVRSFERMSSYGSTSTVDGDNKNNNTSVDTIGDGDVIYHTIPAPKQRQSSYVDGDVGRWRINGLEHGHVNGWRT